MERGETYSEIEQLITPMNLDSTVLDEEIKDCWNNLISLNESLLDEVSDDEQQLFIGHDDDEE